MTSVTLDASIKATSAKSFEKTSSDRYSDTIRNARDIGQVRKNWTRLNLITTLSENEKEDWFSFTSFSKGKVRLSAVNLSAKSDEKTETEKGDDSATEALEAAKNDYEKAIESFQGKGLRVEVYSFVNNRQVLLATNDEKNAKGFEKFKNLMRGQHEIDKGTYYVHVSTEDGKPVKKDTLYALQVQMGDTFKEDYLTKETTVSHKGFTEGNLAYMAMTEEADEGKSSLSGNLLAAQSAASILEAGYTNLADIQISKNQNSAAMLFSLLV
jgi:hypothetical protein